MKECVGAGRGGGSWGLGVGWGGVGWGGRMEGGGRKRWDGKERRGIESSQEMNAWIAET